MFADFIYPVVVSYMLSDVKSSSFTFAIIEVYVQVYKTNGHYNRCFTSCKDTEFPAGTVTFISHALQYYVT